MKLCHQFQPDFVDSFFREHSKKDVNKKFTYIIKVFFQSLVSSIFYMLYAYSFSLSNAIFFTNMSLNDRINFGS